MNAKVISSARALIVVLPLCAFTRVAAAQEPPPPPPPPTYVATAEPVYFNGQATYWYMNHWYWREPSGRWFYYRHEPSALRERRMHGPPVRHFEEHHARRRERR